MRLFLVAVVLAVLVGHSSNILAQVPLVIDLAKPSVSSTIQPGTYYFVFKNRAPARSYSFQINVTTIPIAPFSKPAPVALDASRTCTCTIQQADIDKLAGETQESNVEAEINTLTKEIADASCNSTECKALKAAAKLSIENTVYISSPFPIKQGEQFEVSITRDGKQDEKTLIFSTGPQGVWLVTYGWGVIPNLFGNDRSFFVQKNDTTLRAASSSNRILHPRIVPTIFFSWLPREDELSNWSYGWVGGLGVGFNPTNANLLFGYEATYHWNLMVCGGVAIHDSQKLLAKYEDNPVLTENLDPSQLSTTTVAFDLFLGIAFRFGDNPFSSPK